MKRRQLYWCGFIATTLVGFNVAADRPYWLSDLSVDGVDPTILFAVVDPQKYDPLFSIGGRVLRSDDSGETWSWTLFPLFERLVAEGNLLVASHFSGTILQTSDDWGKTWQVTWRDTPANCPSLITSEITDLIAVNGRVYFTTSRCGIWVSPDEGQSFYRSSVSGDVERFRTVYVDPTNPDVIYAGAASGESAALYRSIDGGETFGTVIGLPRGPENAWGVSAIAQIDGVLYAGLADRIFDSGSLFGSTDDGATWKELDCFGRGNAVSAISQMDVEGPRLFIGNMGYLIVNDALIYTLSDCHIEMRGEIRFGIFQKTLKFVQLQTQTPLALVLDDNDPSSLFKRVNGFWDVVLFPDP